ncbi:MAG: DUF2975 domain-containing protein [Pseudomonadota bacterium]
MNDKPNDLLLLAAKVLTIIMQVFLGFGAVAIVLALPLMLVFQGEINAQVAAEYGNAVDAFPVLTVIGLMALILGLIALAFVFFAKLRAIIGTVGEGDPFAPQNADRLNVMGWLMLACQVLLIPVAGLALMVAKWVEPMENANVTIDAGLDIEAILLVVILFILARVFKHGAAMRDDLEGTV